MSAQAIAAIFKLNYHECPPLSESRQRARRHCSRRRRTSSCQAFFLVRPKESLADYFKHFQILISLGIRVPRYLDLYLYRIGHSDRHKSALKCQQNDTGRTYTIIDPFEYGYDPSLLGERDEIVLQRLQLQPRVRREVHWHK